MRIVHLIVFLKNSRTIMVIHVNPNTPKKLKFYRQSIQLCWYIMVGLFSVQVSYILVFYFPIFQSAGYVPCFMFALWNSTTQVLASVCCGIKLKAVGLNKCFLCDWLFHPQLWIPFSSLNSQHYILLGPSGCGRSIQISFISILELALV